MSDLLIRELEQAEIEYCEEILLPEDVDKPKRQLPPVSVNTLALIVIATGVIFYALYSARAIMFPLTLAAFLALPLRPIMRWLQAMFVPKFVGAALLMASCLMVILFASYWLAAPATEWIEDVPSKLREAELKLRAIAAPLNDLKEATAQVEAITETSDSVNTLKVEVQQPRLSSTVLTATGDFALGSMIAISLAFLLLVFGDDVLTSMVSAMPTRKDRRHLEQLFFDAEQTISRYLLTYTVINIGLGTVIGTALWLIGMPNPILWGVMAATLNYIPFLGLIAGTGVVFLVALLSFDSAAYACLAPAIYLVANGIEANIITPTLLGRSMKLNTVAIFISIVVFGWMWGIGGAIIAVPALSVAKIVCDRNERLAGLSAVLSS